MIYPHEEELLTAIAKREKIRFVLITEELMGAASPTIRTAIVTELNEVSAWEAEIVLRAPHTA